MNNISLIGIKKSNVQLKQIDTRTIKIRKFNEYEIKESVNFTVDDVALSDIVTRADPNIPIISTELQNNFDTEEKIKYLQRLTAEQPADLDSGRIALYVCPFDGDLMCDTIGCRISIDKETVTWFDFSWDGNVEESTDEYNADNDEPDDIVKGLQSFTFNRKEYEALFAQLLGELTTGN